MRDEVHNDCNNINKSVSERHVFRRHFADTFFRIFRLHFFRLHALMRKCSRLCVTHWSCSMWVGIPRYCNCRCCDDSNCSKHLLSTSHTTVILSVHGERHSRDHVGVVVNFGCQKERTANIECVCEIFTVDWIPAKIHSNLSSHMETVFIWVSALSPACLGYQEEAYQQRIPAHPSFVEQ